MTEGELRELVAAVKTGRVARRAFVQKMVGLGLTAPLAGQLLAHVGAAGLRDVPAKLPVERDTAFRIASMTKSFTAMSILKLRDEEKLSLDDPAERYVPEMKALLYPTDDSPKVTIRHLLSHSEGFPEDNPWGDRQLADTDEQLSKMIAGGFLSPMRQASHTSTQTMVLLFSVGS